MDITETLYAATREEWREWLASHHDEKTEIWLVSYRARINRPSVPYNDAVEEALCFGWIDSTRKKIDEERYAQRFTPRRSGSGYSQTNKERMARLLKSGMVIESVRASLPDARPEHYDIPPDILSALQANEDAWEFFRTTSPAYQRIRIAYVDHARSAPAEFEKRLMNLIDKSSRGKQFGYGIEDYF